MAALTAARNTQTRVGELVSVPMKDATTIHMGSMVTLSSGLAIPALPRTGTQVFGIATETVENPGATGAQTITLMRGVAALLDNTGTTDTVTLAHGGANCYVFDDHTVDATGGIGTTYSTTIAGPVLGVQADGVWVHIGY